MASFLCVSFTDRHHPTPDIWQGIVPLRVPWRQSPAAGIAMPDISRLSMIKQKLIYRLLVE